MARRTRRRRTHRRSGRMTFKQARKVCAKKYGISKRMWTCVRKHTKRR